MRKYFPAALSVLSAALLRLLGAGFADLVDVQSDIVASFLSGGPHALLPYAYKFLVVVMFVSSASLTFSVAKRENDFIMPAVPPLAVFIVSISGPASILAAFLMLAFLAGKALDSKFSRIVSLSITASVFVATILYPSYYSRFVVSMTDSLTDLIHSKISEFQASLNQQLESYIESMKSQYISDLEASSLPGKQELISQANQVFSLQTGEIDKSAVRESVSAMVDTEPMRKWFPLMNALTAYFALSLASAVSSVFEGMSGMFSEEKKPEG